MVREEKNSNLLEGSAWPEKIQGVSTQAFVPYLWIYARLDVASDLVDLLEAICIWGPIKQRRTY
jgi:hypothetical protein